MSKLILPDDLEGDIQKILSRSEDFVRSGIWSGIEIARLREWFGHFAPGAEQYFAIKILDSLIYRSEKQTVAMANQLFLRVLPQLLTNTSFDQHRTEWLSIFQDCSYRATSEINFRLVPIIRDSDPPTKSGPALARLYKRKLSFNQDLMIWPWQIQSEAKNGIKLFIMIDDFLGTGFQFKKFMGQQQCVTFKNDPTFVYLPLAAHEKGIGEISKHYNNVFVGPSEVLTKENHNFFETFDNKNSIKTIKHEYVRNCLSKIKVGDRFRYGLEKLAVCYAFEHATPNATLPILWAESPHFRSLLGR